MSQGYQPYRCQVHREKACQCPISTPKPPPAEPSPWKLIEEPYRIAVENDENIIAEIYLSDETDEDSGSERAETLATCKLVRAAPALRDALIAMVEAYEYEASSENPALLEAKAALLAIDYLS